MGVSISYFIYFHYVYTYPLDHPPSSAENLSLFLRGKGGRYYQLTTMCSNCPQIKILMTATPTLLLLCVGFKDRHILKHFFMYLH
jgi:hypothetical protein